jgi:hypothetical protein
LLSFDSTTAQVACCATPATFYLDASSLGFATAVYTDGALVTPAAAGWYSDGVISRYQTITSTLPSLGLSQNCENCNPSGDGTVSTDGSTGMGLYDATFEVGAATGAMVIKYNPNSVPNGILAKYNSVSYNKLSSQSFGKLESTVSTNFTIAGQASSQCSGIVGTKDYLKYIANGSSYDLQSGSQSVTIASGDLNLTTTNPGFCVMVIPKLAATPATVDIEIIAPCENGLNFAIIAKTPAAIPATVTSAVLASSVAACAAAKATNHYIVNTDAVSGGKPQIYGFVFTDANGVTPAADGFIADSADYFQISDGIIIATGSC